MARAIIASDVPTVIGRQRSGLALCKGMVVSVTRQFWRNGEGWVRLANGDEIPDVFVDFETARRKGRSS